MLKDTERMMHDRGKKVIKIQFIFQFCFNGPEKFAVHCYEFAKFDASRRESISEY